MTLAHILNLICYFYGRVA